MDADDEGKMPLLDACDPIGGGYSDLI